MPCWGSVDTRSPSCWAPSWLIQDPRLIEGKGVGGRALTMQWLHLKSPRSPKPTPLALPCYVHCFARPPDPALARVSSADHDFPVERQDCIHTAHSTHHLTSHPVTDPAQSHVLPTPWHVFPTSQAWWCQSGGR